MDAIDFAEVAARQTLALALLVAGMAKILDDTGASGYIRVYRILPVRLISVAEWSLPRLELLLAGLLMLHVTLSATLIFTLLLFMAFALAQISVLAKGWKVPCGCFGNSNDLVSHGTVLRISGLIGLILFCLHRAMKPPAFLMLTMNSITANLISQLAVTAFVVMVASILQLRRNDSILAGGGLAITMKGTLSYEEFRQNQMRHPQFVA